LRPEFRQKILSPFHLKSTVIKHFLVLSFTFLTNLAYCFQ
jgi:hypothetical protein